LAVKKKCVLVAADVIASIPEINDCKHAELDCGKNTDFDVAVAPVN